MANWLLFHALPDLAKSHMIKRYISTLSSDDLEDVMESRRIYEECERIASNKCLDKLDLNRFQVISVSVPTDLKCKGKSTEAIEHSFCRTYAVGNERYPLKVGGKHKDLAGGYYYSGMEWDYMMEAEYRGITRRAYSRGQEVDYWIYETRSGTDGLHDILEMVAGDLGMNDEGDSEPSTLKGLMELLWGADITNHELTRWESGSERELKLWELVLEDAPPLSIRR